MLSENAAADVCVRRLLESCEELARRLRNGEECRAEDFLPSLPIPASEVDAALELIYTEFVVREELGQRPAQAEWYARFPQWRERLERLFPIGALMDDGEAVDAATIALTPTTPNTVSSRELKSVGRWVDQYELLEKIGRGGMGVVYKARQSGLNRVVALKMILTGDDADAEELARFRREAEDIARLQHPNIVQVYAVGEQEGRPFFSMEYLDGGSLAQKIAGKPQPARQAAQWIETLARAMHYAHQRGLVHRDLKPGNVVLTADGVPKITDFGLAKRLAGRADRTWSRPVLGTPGYISPEQAAGKADEISPLCDVYALGAILYELLTGCAPFKGGSPLETLERVQHHEPAAPHSINPLVDRELEAVCLKCLAKRPQQRYASAEALAEDLARWLRGEPTVARPPGWKTRVWRGLRRRPMVAAACLLCLTALVVATVNYFRNPLRVLEAIEREMTEGRTVTLIGEAGQPRWCRPSTNPANMRFSTSDDGVFCIEAFDLGLLELLPYPQVQAYRLSVEVRHEKFAGSEGDVGICFAHTKRSTVQGKAVHYFCALSFHDLWDFFRRPAGLGKNRNDVVFTTQRYIELEPQPNLFRRSHLHRIFAPNGPVHPWRKLAVEVTAERMRAFWEEQPIGELSPVELTDSARILGADSGDRTNLVPNFGPRESLGLYVYKGAASFRNVVVKPLVGDD